MPALAGDLRNDLERTVVAARDTAETAARAVLATLAVERDEPFAALSEEQRRLRRGLRARARQLGGGDQDAGSRLLVEEIAYQQWHRLLFARFLAENGLLMHPQGVPVSLQDCADLAREEGASEAWELAGRYTGAMLPGLFDPQDPAVQVRLAPEHRRALEQSVQDLPNAVFAAEDSLGWAYQFWQSKKKDEVNRSGRKVGAGDIGPVTQLFTEDYMVRFLLGNSLGAWWAARHLDSPLVSQFEYLRFRNDGTPAAGTFPGWPERAAEITVMDPCCGSGHFLVRAFDMLRRIRMEEEGLADGEAGEAVLRDNLFGLEIDPRCTQIAAFALLFAAWKAGGYRPLPLPNIACSGIAVEGQLADWLKLAGGNQRQRRSLERLYHLFRQAPTLGSLIDPTHVPIEERMFSADYDDVAPLLEQALQRERNQDDPAALVAGQAAQGVARAARLLAGQYALVATNVPYLARGKQDEVLKAYCDAVHPAAKGDLATGFLERCRALVAPRGTYALVAPQNWWYLGTYALLRRNILDTQTAAMFVSLGSKAFQTPMWDFNVGLSIISDECPEAADIAGIEADTGRIAAEKSLLLRGAPLQIMSQDALPNNPDARIVLHEIARTAALQQYAGAYIGFQNGDTPRFVLYFWEVPSLGAVWRLFQLTTSELAPYAGRQGILRWEEGKGALMDYALVKGTAAWGKRGVAVALMGELRCTLYDGDFYDQSSAVILPRDPALLPAIWAYCSSPEYHKAVRRIDKTLKVTNATLVKVPFDLAHWQKVAEEAGPLPEPHSDDPTQWLFQGHPVSSAEPLQVAVARLLGYRWPQQKPDGLEDRADRDGIVCLPAVAGEQAGAERLRALLAAAYGDGWSLAVQQQLLADVGFQNKGLADWLRDGFFQQHCRRLRNRPFIWHIWDGRSDGFSALVNYHKLDGPALDKLIYTYLGQWIEAQRAEQERGVAGADGRLVAGLELKSKLEAIRDGEPPYDIYVRWKLLHEQPMGWDPDWNDGVRLNIRPFVLAGVLRSKFTVSWKKDRGKNPDGSQRINDLHYTLEEKRAARRGQ